MDNALFKVGLNGFSEGKTQTDGWQVDGSKCQLDHDDINGVGGDDTENYVTVLDADSGANTVKINGYNAAIVTSKGTVDCDSYAAEGHGPSTAWGGSPSVFIEGKKVHRLYDWGDNPGQGVYNLTTGSGNVLSG